MTPPQATTGSHRLSCSALDKLGDGAIDDREHLFAELGVDEALELFALRSVSFASRLTGHLCAGEHVQVGEHPRMGAGIGAGELVVEQHPESQISEPVLRVLVEFHRFPPEERGQLPPLAACASRPSFSMLSAWS